MPTIRTRTSTGIEIGLVYQRPAPREIGSEAERIQAALLARREAARDPFDWFEKSGPVYIIGMTGPPRRVGLIRRIILALRRRFF